MKICNKCHEEKPITEFYKDAKAPDNLAYACKLCDSKNFKIRTRTKRGLLSKIYSAQKNVSRERNHPQPTYSREEFIKWALAQEIYHTLYVAWVASDYKKNLVPSIDRNDDYLGYSFSNINITTWEKNKAKYHSDVRNGINTKTSTGVECTNIITGETKSFPSIRAASRELKVNRAKIQALCDGQVDGLTWKYKNL